jgi:2-C-methyl-D-erythritol 4-phosphate cytidylyltransferase
MLPTSTYTVTSPDFQPACYALVPCAGVGERAGTAGPKQYQALAGQAVVAHTLNALSQVKRLTSTLVVVAPADTLFEQHAPDFMGDTGWVARVGGASRAQSVLNGLEELLARGVQPHDWVLVHDAARCLVQPAWIDRLLDACGDDEVGGLLALPVADTLKASQEQATGVVRATATVDRQQKWAAQTPQMFRLGLLRLALLHALNDADLANTITDEASAVEALGHQPLLVQGNFENIKITWPDDFALAERLLATR